MLVDMDSGLAVRANPWLKSSLTIANSRNFRFSSILVHARSKVESVATVATIEFVRRGESAGNCCTDARGESKSAKKRRVASAPMDVAKGNGTHVEARRADCPCYQ